MRVTGSSGAISAVASYSQRQQIKSGRPARDIGKSIAGVECHMAQRGHVQLIFVIDPHHK